MLLQKRVFPQYSLLRRSIVVQPCICCGMVRFVQNIIDEFVFRLHRNKWQIVALACCLLCGLVLGVVLYKLPSAYYWQNNRFQLACILVYEGFFAVFRRLALWSAVVVFCCILSCIQPFLRAFVYFAALACGIYVSGSVCALFAVSVVVGILYTLLWSTVWVCADAFLLAWCVAETPCENSFGEAVCAIKNAVYVYLALIFAKILIIFVLLRPIYGLI